MLFCYGKSNTYKNIVAEGEFEYGQNLLKTYVIESNIPIDLLQTNYEKYYSFALYSQGHRARTMEGDMGEPRRLR